MKKLKELLIGNRSQYSLFAWLSFIVALFSSILMIFDNSSFERFLGQLNPLLAIFISILLGFTFLSYLMHKGMFTLYKKQRRKDYLVISGIALAFGVEIILADVWLLDYPADINVPFPGSVLFYPAIGYIVEVFFHVLPIAAIAFVLSEFSKLKLNTIVWISIVSVALLEPLYQVWFTSHTSVFTSIYTGIHVFLFSLAQLFIFKRFDFASMYLFRIIFYLVWHIVWGEIRLELFVN